MGTVIVVGKGPSLIGRQLGKQINGFETVIRLTNGKQNKDYGVRADYVLAVPYETHLIEKVRAPNIWLYDTETPWREVEGIHINDSIKKWLVMYKKIARPLNQHNHSHVTYPGKGTAAILTAMELLKPKRICVAGLDKVMKGERTLHCHDLSAEKRVIDIASKDLECLIYQL